MSEPKVTFVGSGDAFGSGGRLQTCIHISHGEGGFLLDCGATSLPGLVQNQISTNSIGMILNTHLHGDHFGGIPFFLLEAFHISKRKAPLVLAGPEGLKERLEMACATLYPGFSIDRLKFPLSFHVWQAGVPAILGGVVATPFEMVHPSGGTPYALRVEVGNKTITYSGDTEFNENLLLAADKADLFISECCFVKPGVKLHLDFQTLSAQKKNLGAKRIILTHMGAEMLKKVASTGWEYAEDGKVVEV